MKGPHPIDVASAGSGFCTLKRLDFHDLNISDTETLMWAADLLDRHSPILGEDDQSVWTPPKMIFPASILSECDAATYGKHSLLQPALTAAVFLHATHCGLTPTEAGRHPFGNWAIQDFPAVGSERVTDLVVARLAGNTAVDPIAVVCTAATYRACCSKGKNMDGVYAQNIPVMHELQRWLDCHNTIPMVPPEQSQEAQTVGRLAYYPEAWQRTIQNFMFQVCAIIPGTFSAEFPSVGVKQRSTAYDTLFFTMRRNLFLSSGMATHCQYPMYTNAAPIQLRKHSPTW